ncbi:hypothetical protein DFJ74DRAFT_733093 [Hyaloraphidium curvatum]|nr:hypothetical protein DFJ74DRAFT_733093 [Hyaloraphidium curvatum]
MESLQEQIARVTRGYIAAFIEGKTGDELPAAAEKRARAALDGFFGSRRFKDILRAMMEQDKKEARRKKLEAAREAVRVDEGAGGNGNGAEDAESEAEEAASGSDYWDAHRRDAVAKVGPLAPWRDIVSSIPGVTADLNNSRVQGKLRYRVHKFLKGNFRQHVPKDDFDFFKHKNPSDNAASICIPESHRAEFAEFMVKHASDILGIRGPTPDTEAEDGLSQAGQPEGRDLDHGLEGGSPSYDQEDGEGLEGLEGDPEDGDGEAAGYRDEGSEGAAEEPIWSDN